MRSDMSKVIVERPRRGGKAWRVGRKIDLEDLPQKQGMRRPYVEQYQNKELNENLAPLRRFLESKVGMPWADVYSEISANLKNTSAVQQHVRDHLDDFVQTKIGYDKRGILRDKWGRKVDAEHAGRRDMYVDPATGILCKFSHESYKVTWRRQRRQAQEEKKRVEFERDGKTYKLIEGIWYELVMKELSAPGVSLGGIWLNPFTHKYEEKAPRVIHNHAYCMIKGMYVSTKDGWREHTYGGKYPQYTPVKYCTARRQLNSAELKKMGLQNG